MNPIPNVKITKIRGYREMERMLIELCEDASLNSLLLRHSSNEILESEVILTIQTAFNLYCEGAAALMPIGELNSKMPHYIEALVGDEEVREFLCLEWAMEYLPKISLGDRMPTFPNSPPEDDDPPPWET